MLMSNYEIGRIIMIAATDEILEFALKKPQKERARIAKALIASLESSEADKNIELAWKTEIDKRIHEVESGAVKCIPWEEVRDKLKQNANV